MELPCPATRSRRGRSPPSLRAPLCCVPPYNPTTLVASWEEPALTEGAAAHPPHVTWEEPALAEGAAGSSTWTSVPCDAVASWDEPALTEGAAAHQTPTTCTSWEEPALTKGAAFQFSVALDWRRVSYSSDALLHSATHPLRLWGGVFASRLRDFSRLGGSSDLRHEAAFMLRPFRLPQPVTTGFD